MFFRAKPAHDGCNAHPLAELGRDFCMVWVLHHAQEVVVHQNLRQRRCVTRQIISKSVRFLFYDVATTRADERQIKLQHA